MTGTEVEIPAHSFFLTVGKSRATWAEFKTDLPSLDFAAAGGGKIRKHDGLGKVNTKTLAK